MTPFARSPRLVHAARRLLVPLVLIGGLASAPALALAQYEWTDASGRKVYSDVPPAPTEKVSNLVRRTAARPLAPTDAGSTPTGSGDSAGAHAGVPGAAGESRAQSVAAAPSLADREMAFRKRQAEAAEARKKADEKSQADARLARACEDSHANLRGLESGMRLNRVNEAGEREVMTEEEREQRIGQLRRDLSSRC